MTHKIVKVLKNIFGAFYEVNLLQVFHLFLSFLTSLFTLLETFVKNIALLCKLVEKLECSTKCLDGLHSESGSYV